jgi:hypothetical protein
MGPIAGFRWLMNAINLGRNNPKAVFGAAALSLLAMLLPSIVTLPLQIGATPGGGRFFASVAVSVLLGLLVIPLYGGMLSVIDAAEHGRPTKATDVFAPYRHGGGALRIIGFAVCMLLVALAGFAIVVGIAGMDIIHWYMQVLAAQGSRAAPEVIRHLPAGFGTAMALLALFWLLLIGVHAVGYGQVALGGRTPLGALKDGFIGSIKNLLPVLALVVGMIVAMIAIALALLLVVGIAALVAKLVGLWLLFVVAVPVYIALVLTLYVVMFGVMYFMWRDICGGSDTSTQAVAAMAA